MKTPSLLTACALFLGGCSNLTPDWLPWVGTLTPCEKLDTLVEAYEQRFDPLKKHRVNTEYMETWQARYDLVGENCQIAQVDKDTVSYQCLETFKNQDDAVAAHRKAVALIRECVGDRGWLEKEVESADSLKNHFILDDKTPVISVHTGKTLSRFRPWITSLEVGKSVGE